MPSLLRSNVKHGVMAIVRITHRKQLKSKLRYFIQRIIADLTSLGHFGVVTMCSTTKFKVLIFAVFDV